MFGLYNINKPSGITSRDAVNHIQRLVRPAKVGHGGTLDPLASGILLVCVGPATRLIPYIQEMPKRYLATFLLGCQSDTEDIEGNVVRALAPREPSHDEVRQALPRFVGAIQQRPPIYSAVKVAGRRAYQLARRGDEVTLAARTVVVHELNLVAYQYPRLILDVVCGRGTYIRSLGRDLAVSLGTTAAMSGLVRTAIGSFRIADATPLEAISADSFGRYLLPPRRAVESLPQVTVTADEVQRLAHGMIVQKMVTASAKEFAAVDESGQLVAILAPRGPGQLRPVRSFVR